MSPLRVLQVNTADAGGGAEGYARRLHQALLARGWPSELAVGLRRTPTPGVWPLVHAAYARGWSRALWCLEAWGARRAGRQRGAWRVRTWASRLASRANFDAYRRGDELLTYPGTQALLAHASRFDVIHLHNLHGHYFDLRLLPALSRMRPVVLTLHDLWLFTGHCAHPMGCPRWRAGCGACPDLRRYPAVRADHTRTNLANKLALVAQSQLFITAPSRWLLDQLPEDLRARDTISLHLLPIGIDLERFTPGDQRSARARLHLPVEADIVVSVGNATQTNEYKDHTTLLAALHAWAAHPSTRPKVVVFVGSDQTPPPIAGLDVRTEAFQADPDRVADFYRAADVFVHTSRADTAPTVVIEAMACGTPVIASAVGGVPELVGQGDMGRLVAPAEAADLAQAIIQTLADPACARERAQRALERTRREYSLTAHLSATCGVYEQAVARHRARARAG